MLPSKISKWMQSHGGEGGVTAYDGPYGKAPLVEAYKRVGKSVIWVCERVQKG